MDQFQYIKLPDGSYGKFSASASDEMIRGAIEKDFPDAFNAKPAVPVPARLQGGPDPEYKPVWSGDAARDTGAGMLKSLVPAVAGAGKLVSKIPVLGAPIDPQKIADLEEYAKPASKEEQFGKVVGTAAQILPAVATGGEFLGGVADEVAPALSPLLEAAKAPLGRIAMAGLKHAVRGAALGAGYEAAKKIGSLF